MKNSSFRLSFKVLVICAASLSNNWWLSAFAQQPPASKPLAATPSGDPASATAGADDSTLNEIVVTGTNIRGADLVGSSSVSIGRDQIEQNTAMSVSDILKQSPMFAGPGVNETSTSVQGVNTSNLSRATGVNLRGAGPAATLVLLDGQRMIASGQGGIYVDPSTIPAAALERVEIVPDGGSAIYGSDAIGGVVNLILRRDFQGAETSYRYDDSHGYDRYDVNQLLGTAWGSGSVMFAYEHYQTGRLNGTERSYIDSDLTDQGGKDYRVATCDPGNVILNKVSYALPGLIPGTNRCELTRYGDILPIERKDSAVFSATQDVTTGISLFLEGYLSNRNFEVDQTPPSGTYTVPATNAYFMAPAGMAPASESVEYNWMKDWGATKSDGWTRARSITGGVKADVGGGWRIQASFNYGDEREYINNDTISASALAAALASGNPATALNVFGTSANSQDIVNQIFTGLFNPQFYTMSQGGVIRGDGPLFELPAGPLRLAVGAEYRYYYMGVDTVRGTEFAPTRTIVDGKRDVKSTYAEFYVPLLGDAQGIPGVRRLEASAAVRYDDYSDVGNTTNPKFGLNYSPLDGLKFKASYGTSFRVPALSDEYNPSASVTVNTLPDPLSPTGSSTGLVVSNYNSHLSPETAITRSLGVEFSPAAVHGLKLTGDWFSIDYNNRVTTPTTPLEQQALYSALIIRNPTAAQVTAVLNDGLPLSGIVPPDVAFILDNSKANLAATVIRGYDLAVDYVATSLIPGTLSFGADGSYFSNYQTQLTPTAPLVENDNYINNPLKLRIRAYTNWQIDRFTAGLVLNYANAYNNNLVTPFQQVASWTTFDTHLTYRIPDDGLSILHDLVVAFDISNIADHRPPFVNIDGGYDPNAASAIGRMISLGFTKKW